MDYFFALLVAVVGFGTSFISSMVGGGGLLMIPFLIFLGLPANVAIATNKFGTLGLGVGSFIKYFKENKVQWRFVIPLSIIAVFSAFIGANILISANKEFLSRATGVIILVLLPLIICKRELGIMQFRPGKKRLGLGYFFFFAAMVWGAFFGGGAGAIIFFVLMSFFGLTIVQAGATNNIPWIILCIISITIFAFNGLIDFSVGFILILSMFLGGYFGARHAVKKGDKWVKVLFAVIVIVSALKLLFF